MTLYIQPPDPSPEPDVVHIGLLSDPGLPTDLADWLVEHLPAILTATVSDQVGWAVSRKREPIALDEHGRIPVADLAQEYKHANGWDLMLLLTDLPRRSGRRVVASEVSSSQGVGVVSVPALGALRLRQRIRALVVDLVRRLTAAESAVAPARRGRRFRKPGSPRPLSHSRYVTSDDPDIDEQMALLGPQGRFRLLAGLVRDNRPWRLVPHLSSATAAAAATSAYAIVTSDLWNMANALSITRLAMINIVAIAAMAIWLIYYNHLWDRTSDLGARAETILYNSATVLTLVLGVTCMYALLFAASFLAAIALVDPGYLASIMHRPATLDVYAELVWLSSSIGIVAGALGSSLESEEAVRNATYGRRERMRHRDLATRDDFG
jgi:hypothetical protein